MRDLLPPNNLSFEEGLIGSLLLGNREANLELIHQHPQAGSYPYDVRVITIFEAVSDLISADKPVDVISVKGLLEKRGRLADAGGIEYLGTLPDKAPSGWNAPYYAEQLRELFIKRRAIQAGQRISEAGFNGFSTAELLEVVDRELNGIAIENSPAEADIKKIVQSCIDDIEHAHQHQGQPQGITTGLSDLDRTTNGLRPGQLFIIGARPGEGKTSLAANIAEHVALQLKKPAGFFELEMTAKELGLRIISSRSGVSLDRLLKGDLVEENFRQVTLAASALAKSPLHISDESGITISQLRAKARRLHRKHSLELLIVDYLQLVRPSRNNASRNVEISEISSSLKALAKELHIPIIALSQLNRDSDKDSRPPRLRDLRDSGSIEQDADIVGLLYRPKADEPLVEFDIAKHRQGPRRKISLMFFEETFRFRIAAKEHNA